MIEKNIQTFIKGIQGVIRTIRVIGGVLIVFAIIGIMSLVLGK